MKTLIRCYCEHLLCYLSTNRSKIVFVRMSFICERISKVVNKAGESLFPLHDFQQQQPWFRALFHLLCHYIQGDKE